MSGRMVGLWTGWALVLLLAAADLAWHYPQLPERVATHFNAAGVADGWSSRRSYLTLTIINLAVLSLLFPGLHLLVRILPPRWINLPRRDYWFAPQREHYTRARLGELILWVGLPMLATVSGLNHLALRANLTGTPELGPWPWVIVGANLLLVLTSVLVFMARFSRPPR
jgi:hypothetical protein